LVELLGRVISPSSRSLITQDNTNTEEMRTNIHASSGFRTHKPSVWSGEEFHALDWATTVIGFLFLRTKSCGAHY
jgi:hypothetical protein